MNAQEWGTDPSPPVPGSGAVQGLACGTEGNEGCDHGEDEPRYQEPPPMQFGGEVERDHPHLEQGHQLRSKHERFIPLALIWFSQYMPHVLAARNVWGSRCYDQ